MSVKKEKVEPAERDDAAEDLSLIDGEILDGSAHDALESFEEETVVTPRTEGKIAFPKTPETESPAESENTKFYLQYLLLPFIFLTVTLLGGLRIGTENKEFIFYRPALICLIFGAILLVLFFRANLLTVDGWLSEKFSARRNIVNGLTLFTLFTASTQVFNALIPEQGLPFWIVAFCFFWTLWTNLFAEFDTRRLLQSLGGLFGLAFIVKYLILINLVPENSESWLDILSLKNITQETFSYLLSLPDFAGATGYIQFFTLVFYLIGLFLLKPRTDEF
jgi:hypothetical protein